MPDQIRTKSAVSVSEMARMVGLSRARFYQLQGTAFPLPVYDPVTRRPRYLEEQQQVCSEVRQRNCGVDGKPVLFYSKRAGPSAVTRRAAKPRPPKQPTRYADVLEGVRALGYTAATAAQVDAAIRELFPAGTVNASPAEMIRAVFVHLMRQNRADNVGR